MNCPTCGANNLEDSRFCSKCGTPIHPSEEILVSHTRTILKPMEELPRGTILADKFKIIEVIGRGGMGIVYKAEDLKLKRHVALKFLPAELMRDEEAKERFVLEAQAAAALSHPNICTIHEIVEQNGKSFIVMEYIKGQSLSKLIKRGPIELEEALDIAIQIGEGLEEANKKSIVHRDIKSANIMVTDKVQAKIMDFGLAKIKGGTLLTREGTTLGTVAYMSPEQAQGEEVSQQTDIWSFGVVLYEMLTGQLPFKGDREASILYSVVHEEPKLIKAIKPDIPGELQQIINRALKKQTESRYSSASEMLKDLKSYRNSMRADEMGVFSFHSFLRLLRKPIIAIPAIIAIVAIAIVLVWFLDRQAKIRWAKQDALSEIEYLIGERDYLSAFNLAKQIEQYIPKDRTLLYLWPQISRNINIKTDPAGVKFFWKPYTQVNEDWNYLGETPILDYKFPQGYFRIRIEKEGYCTSYFAAGSSYLQNFVVELDKTGMIPDGMVRVPGGDYKLNIPGLDHLPAVHVDDYLIDKFEVTNKEFKHFIENGGYLNKEYWLIPFEKDGRKFSWEEAMAEFKDKTGRTGPATWEAGDYPSNQDDYPVSGICWYEAAAFAEFSGKNLPTIYHWNVAASTSGMTPYIIPLSNFNGEGPSSVGKYKGMSSIGVYDMAGNMREWCLNASENKRFILGGGWNDQTYMFNDAFVQSPFDRSITNGFRCVKYSQESKNIDDLKKPIEFPYRDFMKEKPVSDAVFQIYLRMYDYDKTDLNAEVESIDQSAEDWIKEKISFDAAYGNERVIAYLYLPKTGNPPYQTIVYFPGSNAIYAKSSEKLNHRSFDFILKNGRAVIYPIYKGTYERKGDFDSDYPEETNTYKEYLIMQAKDLVRSIDYLETRDDIDADKIAYYGVSWGGAVGAIAPAIENRIKASILYVAGLCFQRALPEVDAINYVTRIKIPVLMLNGRHDHFFPVETSQKPMFELLGTPREDKKYVLYESGHFVPRNQLIQEALDWLDQYLGTVE